MPKELTLENFTKEVVESKKPVIIKAHASWCGPCVQMTPIFEALEKEFKDRAHFVELNVDQSRDIAINYGVTSIPTFIFIKNGEIVDKETGYIPQEEFKQKIETFLK
jgi:thioredoxin 1